ncbi:MAG TPA: hypothetical protein VNH11_28710, partial [Pirellulales bacterium]|nr:hypothetical protein [Pirellulales bacterium]
SPGRSAGLPVALLRSGRVERRTADACRAKLTPESGCSGPPRHLTPKELMHDRQTEPPTPALDADQVAAARLPVAELWPKSDRDTLI